MEIKTSFLDEMSEEEVLKYIANRCGLPLNATEAQVREVLREEDRKSLAYEFGLDVQTATWEQIAKCLDKQGLPNF